MSREFVRNIKNTKIKGDIKEPLGTNLQNDLLSDDEDVAIRNQNDYHILTDNIKTITSANELLTVNKTGKNTVELDVKPSEDIDLTSYATKEYVDNEINDLDIEFPVTSVNGQTGNVDIEIPEVDLSEYAKTVDVEQEINDTKSYIDTEIENIDIPKVDLSDYAKLEQLQDLTTKKYVDELNTQTRVYVDNKVGEIDVPDVSDFATKEELNEHVDSKNNPHKVTKSQVGLGAVSDIYNNIRVFYKRRNNERGLINGSSSSPRSGIIVTVNNQNFSNDYEIKVESSNIQSENYYFKFDVIVIYEIDYNKDIKFKVIDNSNNEISIITDDVFLNGNKNDIQFYTFIVNTSIGNEECYIFKNN